MVDPKSLGLSFSPSTFPWPFLSLSSFLAFFLSSHFSVPRSPSLSRFPLFYFSCSICSFLSFTKKKSPSSPKSSVHFLFTFPFTFKPFFPSPFLFFSSSICSLLSLAKKKGPIKSVYQCISFSPSTFPWPLLSLSSPLAFFCGST